MLELKRKVREKRNLGRRCRGIKGEGTSSTATNCK
jgi:hypothetical protein